MDPEIVTDVLIVGTGPAGSSLAAFLSTYQVNATIISYHSSTTDESRAHLTNSAALECLRDIGIERECRAIGTEYDLMPLWRHCHTISGTEYHRDNHLGYGRLTDIGLTTPCPHLDLPQDLMEPILVKKASHNGIKVRFDTELISYIEQKVNDSNTLEIISTCRDRQSQRVFTIKSRYLCGADGGRSKTVQAIGATLRGPREETSTCYSVYFEADLSSILSRAPSLMHFVLQPDQEIRPHCMVAIIRTIRLWDRYQLVAIPAPTVPPLEDLNQVNWAQVISELIGEPSIDVKIIGKSKWRVNEVNADFYSKGNVFCLGDAVHRHPPHNGLGSNTCIQDAYNLSWKLAYVLKNIAPAKLLDSYNSERQPVGTQVITRANDSFRLDLNLFAALGMLFPDLDQRKQHLASLFSPTEAGTELRETLKAAFKAAKYQYLAFGGEMNHFYRSNAIYSRDEPEACQTGPTYRDKDWHYEVGTIPGMRLPHAWLVTPTHGRISTHDLAGKGRFTIFTGTAGKPIWSDAAADTCKKFPGLELRVYSIGLRQDYGDTSYMWADACGVEESGAVLVRPDRFVCWRCESKEKLASMGEAAETLGKVLGVVLGFEDA